MSIYIDVKLPCLMFRYSSDFSNLQCSISYIQNADWV